MALAGCQCSSMIRSAAWTLVKKSKSGLKLPQTIAHRGYKAKFPENTMAAFAGAVRAGAHAIETDLHLSKDGVVVLSHVSGKAPGEETNAENGLSRMQR